jgi:two-component system chemotaxis response regulator CheB
VYVRPSQRFDIIVIAASAGGIRALNHILATLPADLPVPIALVQHRSLHLPSFLANIPRLKVKTAVEGESLQPGTVYIAPPNKHLLVKTDHTFVLSNGRRIRHVLSSANPLFASAAAACVIAVVLTGGDSDATDGVQAVHDAGGLVIAQDQATSQLFAMPQSAIETGCVDYVLALDEIGPALLRLLNTGQKKR